jgi:hypothetical protein
LGPLNVVLLRSVKEEKVDGEQENLAGDENVEDLFKA